MTNSGYRYTLVRSEALEAELDRVLPLIAADVEALKFPELRAVVLGGGYGRGEGGVWHTAHGDRLYNDLDLFVFTSGAGRAAARRIDSEIKKLSLRWEKKLGIAVDFGPVKNLEALKGGAATLILQELLRGWHPVLGRVDLADWLPALEPEDLPLSEAVRLLLNRGMGLLLAGEYLRDGASDTDFIIRNMNKAVLGSGDALLIASGRYRWRGMDRVSEFSDYVKRRALPTEYAALYDKAFRYKLEPDPMLPDDPAAKWREYRGFYMDAVRMIAGVEADASAAETAAGLSRRDKTERSVKNLLRWARRTHRVRFPFGMFDAPVVTVLGSLYSVLAGSEGFPVCPPELRRWWMYFG